MSLFEALEVLSCAQRNSHELNQWLLDIPVECAITGPTCWYFYKSVLPFSLKNVIKDKWELNKLLSQHFIQNLTFSGLREMSEKHQAKLKDKIYEAYGKAWKEEEIDTKTEAIKDKVKICCQNADLVSKIYVHHLSNFVVVTGEIFREHVLIMVLVTWSYFKSSCYTLLDS